MIHKTTQTDNFTIIPNAVLADARLSAVAKVVLCYLLSKPADWIVRPRDLQNQLRIGRDKAYSSLSELQAAGYARRTQTMDGTKFSDVTYDVFDTPQGIEALPLTAFQETEKSKEFPASCFSAYGKSGTYKGLSITKRQTTPNGAGLSAPIILERQKETQTDNPTSTDNQPSPSTHLSVPLPSEGKTTMGRADDATPSTSKQIWDDGRALLNGAGPRRDSVIGKWVKQATASGKLEALLTIIRSAARAGTGDPVPYVTAALNKEAPPLANPKTFDRAKWESLLRATIRLRKWDAAILGPAPGKPGCKAPADLITPELTAAIAPLKPFTFSNPSTTAAA